MALPLRYLGATGELLGRSSLPSVPPLGPALTRAPLAIDASLAHEKEALGAFLNK